MYRTCLCFISVLSLVYAANLGHSQRQPLRQSAQQGQAYYYNAPSVSANTQAALRRIVLGHLQRFQQADRQRAQQVQPSRQEVQPHQQQLQFAQRQQQLQQLQPQQLQQQQPVFASSHLSVEYAVAPNTPTPKNYAMNFLPEASNLRNIYNKLTQQQRQELQLQLQLQLLESVTQRHS